ncbi:unnamed protein product [Rotaria magnacalcarata]|uniref:Uncharacterized protein n=1 Tax=Rotaria magnacalcarata TaxID=392030 RepID=A0A815Z7F3_9BILA|nr:unnamed protein product [Rotaria magnacalcarata]CAF1578727.1 unnamed protein product [Rotaria magnacalcarata]CAF3786524.1 unnamed protein product [Rotaria magnacalcarata]CAF3984636.1 unnamed protein product [Rotaria magnacalcarata]
MSCQKGNIGRTRKQKYQNVSKFKNNMFDTSKMTKEINAIEHKGVCDHCKGVLEWKVHYRKYKPLTQAKKCVRCLEKNVIRAYYIMCDDCGAKDNLCCKCGLSQDSPIPRPVPAVEEEREQAEFEVDIKFLRERQRRKFHRLMKQGMSGEEALAKLNVSPNKQSNGGDGDDDDGEDDDDDDDSDLDEDNST